MLNRFSRSEMVLGKSAISKLKDSKVAVFGLGVYDAFHNAKKDEDAKKQELASIQNDLMELEKESTDEIEVEYMQDLLKEKQTEKLAK